MYPIPMYPVPATQGVSAACDVLAERRPGGVR